MDYISWEPYYIEIINDMGYSQAEDEEASLLLNNLFSQARKEGRIENVEDSLIHLHDVMEGKNGYVFGGGPKLGDELKRVVDMELFKVEPWKEYVPAADFTLTLEAPEWKRKMVAVSADSATRSLMESGIVPGVVVTDLDGDVEFQMEAARKGAVILVHAHGDNKIALKEWLPKMSGKIIPTAQCKPRGHVHNFGGFTDGDRAIYMAETFGAKKVTLVGFDYTKVGEKPGQTEKDRSVKSRKLVWAALLTEMIKDKFQVLYFNQLAIF
ncbi:MAG: DUF115 domain-containing protein [Candidatus Thermoplasmatota archaeon]|jgi:hypothetical protein|nr:DUF115 domain-containing protein [Candidatus Thermoplasmatota archaeon]